MLEHFSNKACNRRIYVIMFSLEEKNIIDDTEKNLKYPEQKVKLYTNLK